MGISFEIPILFQSCLKFQQSAPVSSTWQDCHIHKVCSCLTGPGNKHILLKFLQTHLDEKTKPIFPIWFAMVVAWMGKKIEICRGELNDRVDFESFYVIM